MGALKVAKCQLLPSRAWAPGGRVYFCCRGSVLLGESCCGAHGVGRCRRVLEGSWPLAELQTANVWLQEAAGGCIYIYRWLLLQRAGILGTSGFNNELPGFIARQVLRFPAEHRQV